MARGNRRRGVARANSPPRDCASPSAAGAIAANSKRLVAESLVTLVTIVIAPSQTGVASWAGRKEATAEIIFRKESTSTGFAKKPSMPAARKPSRSAGEALAVSA